MKDISQPAAKKDHAPKLEGRSVYVSDYSEARDGRPILTGRILHAKTARARLLSVSVPPLPEGYFYVDAGDVPGENVVNLINDDCPVFCSETVEYIGDAIGMVVGPDEKEVARLLSQIEVQYEELEPVLDLRRATECYKEYEYGHGDVKKAFAEADRVYEEEFETGYQEQVYLETQGMMAEPGPDGSMYIHGSCQCIFSVHLAVARALGCGNEKVRGLQDETGGGFGGKEAYPSILACQVAVAANRVQKPVRCVLDRREDMEYTTKRHPSLCRCRMAVKNGRVSAVDCEFLLNAGAYQTLSVWVLERALSIASGVYSFPSVHVLGRALRTNTVPNDAFRGFGGPQMIFAVERIMDHIAQSLGEDEIAFKEKHLAKQGDLSVTQGRHHFPVPLPEMIDELDKACDFRRKHTEYKKPQTGRFRRGMGVSLSLHGAGLLGTSEIKNIHAEVKLHKYADGRVEILAGNGEFGQGLRTTFPKIVANELGLPLEKVFFDHPDTRRVPDSGPTSASRSIMVVGELLRRAAERLRSIWIEGEEQELEEHYTEPDFVIPFDYAKFSGDAFPVYSWAVCAIEVEVDTLTGKTAVLNAVGNFDVGTPIDQRIVLGQMEGGFLQGIGYGAMEKMGYDDRGRIRNITLSDYLIPTAMDVPKLKTMLHVEKYPCGPYGGKGAGELPLVGAAAAWLAAVEQALGAEKHPLCHIPFAAEDIVKELLREGR
ncbi:MAG: xanthine dehydrogenase family protein molybdopterin-binding subunit [Candidatus Limivicinus sp.]